VPNLEDERFEAYLTQFRPLFPDALPTVRRERAIRRHWALAAWSAGIAGTIVLGVVSFRIASSRAREETGNPQSVSVRAPIQPLTMRNANALLSAAPSYKAALDEMAFHHPNSTVARDKQSALAVLAKEKIRL
jgi:hypothetical protein